MAKKTTFAQESKRIKDRYYKVRKPGEDKITDDGFNAEMKALMMKQEEVKPPEQDQGQQFENGGNLPKYRYGGDFDYPTDMMNDKNARIPNVVNNYMNPIQSPILNNQSVGNPMDINRGNSMGFTPMSLGQEEIIPDQADMDAANYTQNANVEQKPYSPTASILGPALSIGANIAATQMLKSGANKQRENLLKSIGTAKVQAQKVDLSRDRANIRSNQALSESSGRQVAKGARSASEAAQIRRMARLGSQRIAGNQLSRSLSTEESQNAQLRSRADETNAKLGSQDQRQRLAIEQQYGNVPAQLDADLLRSTAGIAQGYMAENRNIARDENYLQAYSPNMEASYQEDFEALTPFQQRMRRLGIGTVNRNLQART